MQAIILTFTTALKNYLRSFAVIYKMGYDNISKIVQDRGTVN